MITTLPKAILVFATMALHLTALNVFGKHIMPASIFVANTLLLVAALLAFRYWINKQSILIKIAFGVLLGLLTTTISINILLLVKYGLQKPASFFILPFDFLPLVSLGWLAGGILAAILWQNRANKHS